jgi:hypothetical protein
MGWAHDGSAATSSIIVCASSDSGAASAPARLGRGDVDFIWRLRNSHHRSSAQ